MPESLEHHGRTSTAPSVARFGAPGFVSEAATSRGALNGTFHSTPPCAFELV